MLNLLIADNNIDYARHLMHFINLSSQAQSKYKDSIIVISGESTMMNQLKSIQNDMIYKLLPKTLSIEQIISEINELVLLKQNNLEMCEIKSFIIDELLYLNYDISHKGTKYLVVRENSFPSQPFYTKDK